MTMPGHPPHALNIHPRKLSPPHLPPRYPPDADFKNGGGGARSATPKKARRGGGAKVSPVGGIETPQGPPGVGVCYTASCAARSLPGSESAAGAQGCPAVPPRNPPVLPPASARRLWGCRYHQLPRPVPLGSAVGWLQPQTTTAALERCGGCGCGWVGQFCGSGLTLGFCPGLKLGSHPVSVSGTVGAVRGGGGATDGAATLMQTPSGSCAPVVGFPRVAAQQIPPSAPPSDGCNPKRQPPPMGAGAAVAVGGWAYG